MPTKAAYLRMETNPETEFEHYLAVKLSMTVADLRERMSNEEFVSWSIYYQRIAQREELERLRGNG
jgi:hypothetical protein